MLHQLNHEAIETSSPQHLGIVFLLMLDQLNYEANPNIITLKHLGTILLLMLMLYTLNCKVNRDIFTLTSWHRFPGNPLPIVL